MKTVHAHCRACGITFEATANPAYDNEGEAHIPCYVCGGKAIARQPDRHKHPPRPEPVGRHPDINPIGGY